MLSLRVCNYRTLKTMYIVLTTRVSVCVYDLLTLKHVWTVQGLSYIVLMYMYIKLYMSISMYMYISYLFH